MDERGAAASAPCLWCGGVRTLRFSVPGDWRQPDAARAWDVYWCAHCDAGSVWPLPAPAEIPGFYPQEYYTHAGWQAENEATSWESRMRQHLAWRLNRETADTPAFLQALLPQSGALSICDLGCGNGLALRPFREAGMHVVGIEPDDCARELAAQHLDEVYAGTAEDLPNALDRSQFDCVRICHVLEHCLEPTLALEHAIQLVRPGGILVMEVPNCGSLGFQCQLGSWPWTDIPRHLHFFTAAALRSACEQRGLQIECLDFRGFARQLTDGWLADEQQIHAALYPEAGPIPVRRRAWGLLLRGLFASRESKYDSVYVVARRPDALT